MNDHSEKTRRAVRWISDTLQNSDSDLNALIHEAISKFDLDPRQSEELIHFYRQSRENEH